MFFNKGETMMDNIPPHHCDAHDKDFFDNCPDCFDEFISGMCGVTIRNGKIINKQNSIKVNY